MKILADTNRIIAALVKNSTTRMILFDDFFEFVAADFTVTEIREHEKELLKKMKINKESFEILLTLIFERIQIIPREKYQHLINECKPELSDIDDVLHLAACIAVNAYGIWSHDPHFLEQHKVNVLTNIDMLRLSGKAKNRDNY